MIKEKKQEELLIRELNRKLLFGEIGYGLFVLGMLLYWFFSNLNSII